MQQASVLQSGFILHLRPYRETSVLLDVFTENEGRISLIARGVRQARSKWKSILQPFVPLLLSYQGRGELQQLNQAEGRGLPIRLRGSSLWTGLYLNEILVRLLQKHDPHPELYTIYEETLLELQGSGSDEKPLRLFEKKLLDILGYGLQLNEDCRGNAIDPEAAYRFHPEQGFEVYLGEEQGASIFLGKNLLAFAEEILVEASVLKDAKRLMRLALLPLLGSHEIKSRKLFSGSKTKKAKIPDEAELITGDKLMEGID